jgi:spastin
MKGVEHNLNDKEFYNIASMTSNYSNSDLKELCREAALQPLREIQPADIKNIKKLRQLVYNDMLQALKNVRGTLNNEMIKELEDWNKQYGALI